LDIIFEFFDFRLIKLSSKQAKCFTNFTESWEKVVISDGFNT